MITFNKTQMLGIGKVNRTLIFSDFLLQSGLGLTAPIFAVFLIGLRGGTVGMIGIVAAAYWLVKSVAQPFIARFLDIKKGEKDDFKFLIAGMYIANLVPLGYIFSTNIIQIIILEIIRGLAMACVVPTWSAIFTRHMDKGWEAFSWSIESTGIGFAAGLSGALGGLLVTFFNFKIVFVLMSLFGLFSTTFLLPIWRNLYPRSHFVPTVPPNEKPF